MKLQLQLDFLLIVFVLLVESVPMPVAHATENGNFAELVDIGGGRTLPICTLY